MIGRRTAWLSLFSLLPLFAAMVRAEDRQAVVLSGESRAAALRLAEARKRLDEHKWSEAIEELQTLLTSAGDDLVPLTPSHSVRASRLCQIQLASLPAEALRLYRQRYEKQAGKKLQQAQAERDGDQLRKLVEEAFCTRAAEQALDALGDGAFERGRFDEAEQWWRLLAPLPDPRRDAALRANNLVYPDPRLDPARLQAKQLLARLFQGSGSEWTEALDAYRKQHAQAEGTLAGRTGRYVELLHELAEERKKQGDANPTDWPTFAGAANRGRVISSQGDILDRLSNLCREGPTWTFNLEKRARQDDAEPAPAFTMAQARSLAFYPVVVGHRVLVADARYVTAYDLRKGESRVWYDGAHLKAGVEPNLKLPAAPDLRYSLTVAGENVFVRLGAQDIGVEAPAPPPRLGQKPKPRRANETFLTCLGLHAEGEGEHHRWDIRGIVRDHAFFEGAPLVAEGLIWIASTRYNGDRCLTAIDCYGGEDHPPPLRWRREVCETRETKIGEQRYRHQLLTLAGTQLVYCTHNGAVVAIDARTGRTNWARRYSRRTSDTEVGEFKDLAPVLFAAGRLYAAPADSDSLLCLDPATGRTLWERQPLSLVHLLGVGQGRLIFTTPKGLRAVRADDGDDAWFFPQAGELMPAGRGLLLGDLILFPTTQVRDALSSSPSAVVYAVRQSDGRAADDPARLHRLPSGNLVYANGCLAVADQKTLSVFVPPRMRLRERQAEARRHPDSAMALRELARAEADAGRIEEALRTLRQAKPQAAKNLNQERLRLLLDMAQHAAADKRWEDADNALREAATLPLAPRRRLHALLRAAQIWQDAKQSDRAQAVWKTIRADETLRTIQVIDREGSPFSLAAVRSPPSALRSAPNADGVPRSLPLFRTWHAALGRDEWVLAGWPKCDPEVLLTGAPDGRFICRLTSTGGIRWNQRLPFGPRWAGCHADRILAAGEGGIVCLHRDKGELLWHFPAPVAGRYPRAPVDDVRVVLDPQPPEPLTAFQLVAGRLFLLQGQRRLFALNAETGAVLWDRWAPDGELHLPFPRGCFSPCYHAGSAAVLVQMSGRRWLLDAATGRLVHEAADNRDLWQRPPLQLDERTLCVTPDCRHVEMLDALTGRCLWTHRLAEGTTLSGEMPSVLGRGDVLLILQPANVGYSLQRLDRVSGKPVWPRPPLLAVKSPDLSAWTFDGQAVYGIEEDVLTARSLRDGRILWRQSLHGAKEWQARRVGDYLAVTPRASAEARFRFRSPLGAVQWHLGSLLAPDALCSMSCHDPETGPRVQRLNFRIASPLRTTPGKRTMGEDGDRWRCLQTSSLLADEIGPAIRLDSPRPFVAIGGDVWGLTATPPEEYTAAEAGR
jgi:outer membrane protein assembly factor BamB/tetratricopeptide (TPR) repeat protein